MMRPFDCLLLLKLTPYIRIISPHFKVSCSSVMIMYISQQKIMLMSSNFVIINRRISMSRYNVIENAARIEKQIEERVLQYQKTLVNNFNTCESKLIDFLLTTVKDLKRQISKNKILTSQQNLDELISRKRAALQLKREKQECSWRQLNQKYKKLLCEQKELKGELRQYEFEVNNLIIQIDNFEKNKTQIQESILNLQNKQIDTQFITQNKKEYRSPYRLSKIQRTNEQKRNAYLQNLLRLKENELYTSKYCRINQCQVTETSVQNQQKTSKEKRHLSDASMCPRATVGHLKSLKNALNGNCKSKLRINCNNNSLRNSSVDNHGLIQVLRYISLGHVRQKIFYLLNT